MLRNRAQTGLFWFFAGYGRNDTVLAVASDQTAPLSGALLLADGRPNWQVQVLVGGDHHPLLHMRDACLDAIDTALAR